MANYHTFIISLKHLYLTSTIYFIADVIRNMGNSWARAQRFNQASRHHKLAGAVHCATAPKIGPAANHKWIWSVMQWAWLHHLVDSVRSSAVGMPMLLPRQITRPPDRFPVASQIARIFTHPQLYVREAWVGFWGSSPRPHWTLRQRHYRWYNLVT